MVNGSSRNCSVPIKPLSDDRQTSFIAPNCVLGSWESSCKVYEKQNAAMRLQFNRLKEGAKITTSLQWLKIIYGVYRVKQLGGLGSWEGDHTQHLHRSQEMWLMYKNACFPVYIWVPLVWQESRPTTASLNKDRHWQRPYLLCLQLPSQIRGALEFMSISRVLPPIDYFSISHSNNPFYRIYYMTYSVYKVCAW